jgi:hypothetical protein
MIELGGILIRDRLTREHAETIALNGLAFLAGRDEDIERFLRNTGIDADELRQRAADPDMLRAVLEYILAGDATTTDFCAEQKLDPRQLHAANHVLSGAREV